jgi:hypothetical protein
MECIYTKGMELEDKKYGGNMMQEKRKTAVVNPVELPHEFGVK